MSLSLLSLFPIDVYEKSASISSEAGQRRFVRPQEPATSKLKGFREEIATVSFLLPWNALTSSVVAYNQSRCRTEYRFHTSELGKVNPSDQWRLIYTEHRHSTEPLER